jgi:ABC-type dipeptide/oligopeptide/nickel transport system ATPase component
MTEQPILVIDDLHGGFPAAPVLKGVSLTVPRHSITAVVGETGSGKTLTVLCALGLVPRGFQQTSGSITFDGEDITHAGDDRRRKLRGSGMAVVFQDAKGAINPVFTVGRQLSDVIRLHRDLDKKAAHQAAVDLLDQVKISEPARRMKQYVHELSGGMAQRAQLAMALACRPRLLVLDEPTTGLDVTIQADILELIVDLTRTEGMTTCMITHDLGVVAETCDQVAVLRYGETVETGTTREIFTDARHPYTQALIADSRLSEVSAA